MSNIATTSTFNLAYSSLPTSWHHNNCLSYQFILIVFQYIPHFMFLIRSQCYIHVLIIPGTNFRKIVYVVGGTLTSGVTFPSHLPSNESFADIPQTILGFEPAVLSCAPLSSRTHSNSVSAHAYPGVFLSIKQVVTGAIQASSCAKNAIDLPAATPSL